MNNITISLFLIIDNHKTTINKFKSTKNINKNRLIKIKYYNILPINLRF
jgi:hypothetical protein